MAFRRSRLAAIGGFDPLYRTAGDDVDVCWRLQDQGWTIGFSAAAMVWHHRRATTQRYWRQQVGYGKAEALLERKWPSRFTTLGHMSWAGQIYGRGLPRPALIERPRIYQGTWGLAPYQGLYQPAPNHLLSIALTPEWLLLAAAMFGLGLLGLLVSPLAWAFVPFVAMIGVSLAQALRGAMEARFLLRARDLPARRKSAQLCAHFLLPPASARGAVVGTLEARFDAVASPVAERIGRRAPSLTTTIWSEIWRSPRGLAHRCGGRTGESRAPSPVPAATTTIGTCASAADFSPARAS